MIFANLIKRNRGTLHLRLRNKWFYLFFVVVNIWPLKLFSITYKCIIWKLKLFDSKVQCVNDIRVQTWKSKFFENFILFLFPGIVMTCLTIQLLVSTIVIVSFSFSQENRDGRGRSNYVGTEKKFNIKEIIRFGGERGEVKKRLLRIKSQRTKIYQNLRLLCCLHCWQRPTVPLVWKKCCHCLACRGWIKQKTTLGQPSFVVGNHSNLMDHPIETSFISCFYFHNSWNSNKMP